MKIRKNYAFDKEFVEMLATLQKQTNHTNETAVIIQAVSALYSKLNPAYKSPMENRNLSPEDKAAAAVKFEEEKQTARIQKYLEIAKALDGEVYDAGAGEQRVSFYNYFENNRDKQDYALEELSMDLLNDQYLPSKEDVLRRQKEGKTKY